jgi:hypothetical protein
LKIEEVALNVIEALDIERIPYMLVGSFSSNFYGIPRSTADADIVVQLAEKSITSIVPHLHSALRLEPQMSFETVTGTMKHVLEAVGRDYDFKVEVFRLSDDPHDQERFRRRRAERLFDRDIYLPTAEDVIVTKLRWLRRKDRPDIENVIQVQQATLDWQYIERWCEAHQTRDSLYEILGSIGISPPS